MSVMTTITGLTSNLLNAQSLLTAGSGVSVAPTNDLGLVQTSVDLSGTADIIASFGTTGTDVQTYTAAGLLNSISQAGNSPSTSPVIPAQGTDTQSLVQQSTDQGVIGSLASDPMTSGIYSSSGMLQSSIDSSSNWATALQANPGAAGTAISDSFAQGIVGTLLATA